MTPCLCTYTAIASRSVRHGSCPRRSAMASISAHNSSDISTVRSLRLFMAAERNHLNRQDA